MATTSTSLTDFIASHPPVGFASEPYYCEAHDYLTLYLKDADHFEKRIDSVLTLYLAMDSEELVGCKVKGLKEILNELGSFGMNVCKDEVEIGMIFYAAAKKVGTDDSIYRDLGMRWKGRTIRPKGLLSVH